MDKIIKNNKKIFWVEKISLSNILVFWLKSFFIDIRVNYNQFQTYPFAAKFLKFFGKSSLNKIFFPVELPSRILDVKGAALIYKVDKELDACIEDFISKNIPQESGPYKEMFKSYLAINLQPKVIFITMVDCEIASGKVYTAEINTVYLNSQPFNYLLYSFYRSKGWHIKYSPFSLTSIAFYFMPFCYLGFFILCKLSGRKAKTNIAKIRPAIWVEYYPSRWHSFWLSGIKREDFDIVSYLDRKDTPVTTDTAKEIVSYGSKWIDAHLLSLVRMSRLGMSGFGKLLLKFFLVYFSKAVYIKIFNFQYTFLLLIYESVFLRYKVKILIQHQEASWKQQVQALAIERAGGIMVGYHWSAYQYYRIPTHIFPQHVYFAWGKIMGDFLRKKDNRPAYVLPSGIWIVPDSQINKRKIIFDKHVDFVVSVFDSAVEYNSLLPPSSLSEFYSRILKILRDHANFGCIIKGKQSLDRTLASIPYGDEILKEVEILKRQNRLFVFDSSEYPLSAAAYSNLSVGYDINSACVVVAVIGNHRAINWDSSGFSEHPFYRHAEQKIVFKTLDGMEEAILKASKGDKTVGDYAFWKKHFNYFEDYSAINRMSNFLESYMGETISTGDRKHALDFAVKKYLNDNKIGDDFYQEENLWGGGDIN